MVTPPGNESGGVSTRVSDNSADQSRDDATSNLVDRPIRQCIPGFGLRIIRPENGCGGGQHADHSQSGGDHSNPSHLAGEYDGPL